MRRTVIVAAVLLAGCGGVDRQDWAAAFCRLSVGDTRDAARAAMGDPTTTVGTGEAFSPQDDWEDGSVSLAAFYGPDGRVVSLSSSGDAVPCAASR